MRFSFSSDHVPTPAGQDEEPGSSKTRPANEKRPVATHREWAECPRPACRQAGTKGLNFQEPRFREPKLLAKNEDNDDPKIPATVKTGIARVQQPLAVR